MWAYQTTLWKATNEMPYSLAFRFEVVIPHEVSLPTLRIEAYDVSHNEEVLARDLNLAKEQKENTLIRMDDYQKQLAKTYNQKVQHIKFFCWRSHFEEGFWTHQGPDRWEARP